MNAQLNTMPENPRLLVVDDDECILNGMRRMLYTSGKTWEVTYASRGTDALEAMEEKTYDAALVDIQMPGMNGPELLAMILHRQPQAARFALSGYVDQSLILRAAGLAHRFFAKPCDTPMLYKQLEHILTARGALQNEELQQLVCGMESLPILPATHEAFAAALMDPAVSNDDLADLAANDMAIAAKLMHMACWDTLQAKENLDLKQALLHVGRDALVNVFSYEGILQVFDEHTSSRMHLPTLHAYALRNARSCAKYCRTYRRPENDIRTAFLAGLLHHTGLIVLAARKPDLLAHMRERHIQEGKPLTAIETEAIGCDHFTLGGALLRLWGLPDNVVQSITFSHDPSVIIEPGSPSDALRYSLENKPFDCTSVGRRLTGSGHPPLSPELSVSPSVRRPAMETQYAH